MKRKMKVMVSPKVLLYLKDTHGQVRNRCRYSTFSLRNCFFFKNGRLSLRTSLNGIDFNNLEFIQQPITRGI